MKLSGVFVAIAATLLTQGVVSSPVSLTEESLKAALTYEIAKWIKPGLELQPVNARIAGLALPNVVRNLNLQSSVDSRASPLMCILCRSTVNVIMNYRKEGMAENRIINVITDLCSALNIQNENVCRGVIELNAPSIFYIVDNKQSLTAHTICGIVYQSESCGVNDEEFEWTVEVDNGAPKHKSSDKTDETLKIVQITDVHYDPVYEPYGNPHCDEPTCCRVGQNDTNTSGKLAGYWGDYNDCDSPWHVIENAIDQIKNTEEDISYIYYTGDVIDHGVWETSRDGNIKSIIKTFTKLYETFDSVPIFPALGNHESHPMNVYAPVEITNDKVSGNWLFELVADLWIGFGWLPESTRATILQGGFYTVSPKPGFRIITLNNNVCYVLNWWLLYEPQDPFGQLNWLAETLLKAEENGEYVHIVSHIPPGTGSCQYTWGRQYRKILNRFANVVTAEFSGHTHNDEIRIIYDLENPTKAIRVAWVGGGVTPYSDVNPNYKVYSVEANTYAVEDIHTWIYNLTLANETPDKNPIWFKSYSFKEEYGLEDLSLSSLNSLVYRMARDPSILSKYHGHYMKQADSILSKGCDQSCLSTQLCRIVTSVGDDSTQCDYFTNLN